MFNPFSGYSADTPASIFDVERRKKLADQLSGTGYVQNSGPLGALAQALGGAGAGFENKYAADEAQSGYESANKALADALSGGANMSDPSALITAGGNPFLPPSESGLVGDLIKRKLGIGETFFGTPQVSFDAQGTPHYSIIGSLGSVKEIKPPSGAGDQFSYKQQLVDTPQAAGVAVDPYRGNATSTGVTKENAQAAFDTEWGKALGTDWAAAPQELQKEGQLVQTQVAEHKLVDSKIDTAIQQIDANPSLMTGFVGDILKAAPGTPQYDLGQTLQTIKANIGFDTLQNMRANSATGGALGQISNMEELLLQAVNGSLEPGQSAAQLAANLKDIKQRVADLTAAKQQAMLQDINRYKSGPQTAPTLGAGNAPPLPAPAPLTPPVDLKSKYGLE